MDVGNFYAFAQCSLKMEAQHLLDKNFKLKDPEAKKLWHDYETLALRNLGKNEKWVPWHTVLGVHEFFLVKEVHHAEVSWWSDYERFVCMFVFRCHCKIDLFSDVQVKHLTQKSNWKNLAGVFAVGSKMEKDMLKFRAEGKALQTSCFLIIPERILKDDDQNLVRNICLRSQRLVGLADLLWPIVNDRRTSSKDKYDNISKHISAVRNLGPTWVKMLMVCIDICKPELRLLHRHCEVGVGAANPLREMLEDEGLIELKVPRVNGKQQLAVGVTVVPQMKAGVCAVKQGDQQLIQVTKGMAGTFDRAHAVAEELRRFAVAKKFGPKNKNALVKKRKALFEDRNLKVPKLGLDAMMHLALNDTSANPRLEKQSSEPTPSDALIKLCDTINANKAPSAAHFWRVLAKVEDHGRKHFKKLGLVKKQMKTKPHQISAVTLQVQLCEFRQFQNYCS